MKNTICSKLDAKVIKLNTKIPDATTLIQINQCNTDKQNLEKKVVDIDKIYPLMKVNGLVTTTVFNTKIGVVENRILLVVYNLVTIQVGRGRHLKVL